MLNKRASGEAPAPQYSEAELRIVAIEMQKLGFSPLGMLASGFTHAVDLPRRLIGAAGTAAGHVLQGTAGTAGKTGLGLLGTIGGLTGGAAAGLPGAAAGAAGGVALSKVPQLLARLTSGAAAIPFDHPGAALNWGPALGFPALDMAYRMKQTKAVGEAAKRVSTPAPIGRNR